MTNLVTKQEQEIGTSLMIHGDLSKLTMGQKAMVIQGLCKKFHLNPLTKPFALLRLQGKEQLYALKNCTDQLRSNNGVSITIDNKELVDDVFIVTVKATMGDRTDTEMGAVAVSGLSGEALANAKMKALTKAKRRVTLSICGLSFLDETEVETIPNASIAPVDLPEKIEVEDDLPPEFDTDSFQTQEVYRIGVGNKHRGKSLEEVGKKDCKSYAAWLMNDCSKSGRDLSDSAKEFIEQVNLKWPE